MGTKARTKPTFDIGGTEFGFEPERNVFKLERQGEFAVLDLELRGAPEVMRQIHDAGEQGDWWWMPHPPYFYVRGLRLTSTSDDLWQVDIDDELLDEYDIGLYIGKHLDVFGRLTISGKQVTFTGQAATDRRPEAFTLRYTFA